MLRDWLQVVVKGIKYPFDLILSKPQSLSGMRFSWRGSGISQMSTLKWFIIDDKLRQSVRKERKIR